MIEHSRQECLGDSERREESRLLGVGVFIEDGGVNVPVLSIPGSIKTGTSVQVSSVGQLCPGVRDVDIKVSGVRGLGKPT